MIKKPVLILMLCCFCIILAQGQSTVASSGGNATGDGGSASYTVGQVTFNTYSATNGSVAQGVQQPYEISVLTGIEETEDIVLEYKVYPNPARRSIILNIKPFETEKMSYRLFDLNGILLQDKKIESDETEISVENLSPALYFLKVIKDNQEVKVFKLIKN